MGLKAFKPRFAGLTVIVSLLFCVLAVDPSSARLCNRNYVLIGPSDSRIFGLYYRANGEWSNNRIGQVVEAGKKREVTIVTDGTIDVLIDFGGGIGLQQTVDLCIFSQIIVSRTDPKDVKGREYRKKDLGYYINFN